MARCSVEIAAQPSASLRFLYNTVPGRIALKLLTRVWVSRLVGAFMSCPLSRPLIRPFIRKNHIDMSRYVEGPFPNYNAFFTRRLREAPTFGVGLVSPCDSKLTAYKIDDSSVFTIKGSEYSLADILEDGELAASFRDGWCLIFRLAVEDYHRYSYFDTCTELRHKYIKGILHTVQPIALRRHNVYRRNCREYTVLETAHFGTAVQVEVGATCVGRIANLHKSGVHSRGEEKGMFLFGGSTILLLLKSCQIDRDILENTAAGKETIVHIGEQIGY